MKNNFPKKEFKTIKWLDHFSDGSWKDEKEIKDWATKGLICVTKGWVTYEDNKVVVLSASFDGDSSYGENMCILKNNIIK